MSSIRESPLDIKRPAAAGHFVLRQRSRRIHLLLEFCPSSDSEPIGWPRQVTGLGYTCSGTSTWVTSQLPT